MTNWFQTQEAMNLFERHIRIEQGSVSCLGQVLGWGPSRRAIIQGGPQVPPYSPQSAQALYDVMVRFRKEAEQQHCVYAEIRCFDDYSAYRSVFEQAGWGYQPHYDIILDVRHTVPDAKMRQIRAAMQQGYTWREATSADDVQAFFAVLRHLYRTKVHRPLPNVAFFLQAWQQGVKVLVVEQAGAVVGGVLMPILGTTAYEWYICGQVMSTWAMIDYGRQHGVERIDMMGAGEPGVPYGVRDFKMAMGGELHDFGRYICVLKLCWYKLGYMLMK